MVKTHEKIGKFFESHTDIGSFVYVFSLLGAVISFAAMFFLGGLVVQFMGGNFTSFIAIITIKPFWISILLFPIFLYLIDRSIKGTGK